MNESKPVSENALLSQREQEKIRAEVRYALIAANAARGSEPAKSRVAQLLSYLSNGFIILLVGAFISSYLVPDLQRQHEKRKRQAELMNECFSQFLIYSNSLWEEHYASLPLTQEIEIDKAVYLDYVKRLSAIKLKRYDAYARMLALAKAFRKEGEMETGSQVEASIRNYALQLNRVSSAIDYWLTGLYCTPVNRRLSPCDAFDPHFDAFDEHLKIKTLVNATGNEAKEEVAAVIVAGIVDQ